MYNFLINDFTVVFDMQRSAGAYDTLSVAG